MYIYVYMYMCVYVYVYIHIYVYVYIYIYIKMALNQIGTANTGTTESESHRIGLLPESPKSRKLPNRINTNC